MIYYYNRGASHGTGVDKGKHWIEFLVTFDGGMGGTELTQQELIKEVFSYAQRGYIIELNISKSFLIQQQAKSQGLKYVDLKLEKMCDLL
jgi:hypothetical protein